MMLPLNERRCPACRNGKLVAADDIISDVEGYFFVERGSRCGSCGEEFVPEREGAKMIVVARRLGVWGEPVKLYRKLTKTARGVVLRIPSDLERSLAIRGDEEVTLSKVGRKLCIDFS